MCMEAGNFGWFAFGSAGYPNHIGLAAGALKLGYAPTVEGNTNAAGSREGNEMWERRRASSLIRGVIRLECKPTR